MTSNVRCKKFIHIPLERKQGLEAVQFAKEDKTEQQIRKREYDQIRNHNKSEDVPKEHSELCGWESNSKSYGMVRKCRR